ncbi:MAG: ankyrin repeat domain-containing protein, partial [Terriglobia bacterium]
MAKLLIVAMVVVVGIYPSPGRADEAAEPSLFVMIDSGDLLGTRKLLERDPKAIGLPWQGETPLMYSLEYQRNGPTVLALVRLLLAFHADPFGAQDRLHRTPLHLAAQDDFQIMQVFVELGADLDARDGQKQTPINYAICSSGGYGKAVFLVEHGADVNAAGCAGMTPLHLAAFTGDAPLCTYLIGHGARVNSQDDSGESPLHKCTRWRADVGPGWKDRSAAVAEVLLGRGANVNGRVRGRFWTPLQMAAAMDDLPLVKVLCQHGADLRAIEPYHQASAYTLACQAGAGDVAEYLGEKMMEPPTVQPAMVQPGNIESSRAKAAEGKIVTGTSRLKSAVVAAAMVCVAVLVVLGLIRIFVSIVLYKNSVSGSGRAPEPEQG